MKGKGAKKIKKEERRKVRERRGRLEMKDTPKRGVRDVKRDRKESERQ
jgi:hypothetical protein